MSLHNVIVGLARRQATQLTLADPDIPLEFNV